MQVRSFSQFWGARPIVNVNKPIWSSKFTCLKPTSGLRLRDKPLQWRHNEPNGVSNHRHPDCLHNHLSKKTSKLRRSKKTSKLRYRWSIRCYQNHKLHLYVARIFSPVKIFLTSGFNIVIAWKHIVYITWWRHQMETFSALLALCEGNSLVTGEFLPQRPVTRIFNIFFDLRLNKRLSKQPRCQWFETPSRPLWHHRNVGSVVHRCLVFVLTCRI